MNQPDLAYQELLKASDTDPAIEPAEITMARLYSAKQDQKQAESWIKQAQEKHSANDLVAVTYGLWLLDRGRNNEAAAQAKRASEIAPDQPRVKALFGLLARTIGKHDRAEQYFQELSINVPGNFDFSNQLILSMIEQDDEQKQQRALQLAEVNARQYPRSEQALATLGWVFHRLGRADEAQQLLKKAVSAGRASADTVDYFARAAVPQDQTKEVRELLEKALQSDGRFVNRRHAQQWLEEIPAEVPSP